MVGIILGAGSSRRLGTPKQLLRLGDTTLLGWALRDAEASSLERVVLVLGREADDVRASLDIRRAEVAYNERYGSGCASSLLAGLDAAGACDAVMLLLGDMPGVDPAVIDAVRSAWEAERPSVLVTEYDDGLGHPLVFAAAAFGALRALHGDKAVWKLVEAGPERVRRVRIARTLPRDVDTWEDYEAVRQTFASGGTAAERRRPAPAPAP
jgi:molybdenum cofactor cytidylyltransferase